jgi:hypothetical protein
MEFRTTGKWDNFGLEKAFFYFGTPNSDACYSEEGEFRNIFDCIKHTIEGKLVVKLSFCVSKNAGLCSGVRSGVYVVVP